MSHRFHPDESDPEGSLLFDNCPGCATHAQTLVSLDVDKAHQLWLKAIRWNVRGLPSMTIAEQVAMVQFWKFYLLLERDPDPRLQRIAEGLRAEALS